MALPWEENVDSDQFHRDIEWDLGRTDYTPATDPYVAPWERDNWGANDVVITPPRNPGGYVRPERPLIRRGQTDYVFMPTEKGARRERREQAKEMAELRGRDWREERLPRSAPKEPKERVYRDWREVELPERREVSIQPAPRREREWGESRPGEAYIQIEGPGNPSWERRNPRVAAPRQASRGLLTSSTGSLRDLLMGEMRRGWR